MTLQSVTLRLPSGLYRQIQHRAQRMKHSVEDELTAVIETVLSTTDDLVGVPPNIAAEVAQLRFLDDQHLGRAAQRTVPTEKTERMQTLSLKRQAEGLTHAEQQEAEELMHLSDLVMLTRAEAAVLLQERGFDITALRPPPD